MNCQDCELLLGQDEITAEVRAHLAGCAECRALSEELQANEEAFASMREEVMPVGQAATPDVATPDIWKWASTVAAAVALAWGIWHVWGPGPRQIPRDEVTVIASADQPAAAPTLPIVRHVSRTRRTRRPPAEVELTDPSTIRIQTSDPEVVIYWVIEEKGEPKGE